MAQHMTACPIVGKTTTTPTTTEAGSIAYPITLESFVVDGTNWKKVYSDGWIEMGGFSEPASTSGYASREIRFNWSFPNVCISINCQPTAKDTTTGDAGLYGVRVVTKDGFTFTRGSSATYTTGFYWIARGI